MKDAAGSAAMPGRVTGRRVASSPPREVVVYPPRQQATPAPAPLRRTRGRWASLPYLFVLALAGSGLWWASQSARHARGGTVAVAGALLIAALARLMLPEEWAGMLASRRRFTDVVTLVALAAGLLVAGLVLPPSP